MEKYPKFHLEATSNRMWTLTRIHMVLNDNYLETKKYLTKERRNQNFQNISRLITHKYFLPNDFLVFLIPLHGQFIGTCTTKFNGKQGYLIFLFMICTILISGVCIFLLSLENNKQVKEITKEKARFNFS